MFDKSNDVITTQLTSKRLKFQYLLSRILFVVSFLWVITIATDDSKNGETMIIGFTCLFAFILLCITRFQIWWYHK